MKAYNFEGEQACRLRGVCAISGSGGSSSGSSKNSSSSGNNPNVRNAAASNIFGDTGNIRNLIDSFLALDPTLNLNEQGLTPGAATQANQLVSGVANNLFNTHSSTVAQSGGLSPKNTAGIIADASSRAASSVLPTTLAQAQQNEQFNVAAPGQQLATGANLLTQMDALLAALTQGSESSGKQSQSSSNFGFGILG